MSFFKIRLPFLLLLLTLPLYLLDQATKFWTVRNLPQNGYFETIPGVFHWARVHNQGVAFGLGNGTAWAPVVFLFVPVLAIFAIRWFWQKGVFQHPLARIALALLICGIFGNLTDRLVQGFLLDDFRGESFWSRLTHGYVVDFITVKLPFYEHIDKRSGGWWPAFNVADSCICVAAVLLLVSGMLDDRRARLAAKSTA